MFGRPFRVGSLLGVSITVSWTFIALLGLLALNIAARSGSFLLGLLAGLLWLSLVFASVLVHELGHSVVARRLGVAVPEIELHFFGGAAKLASLPRSPRDEALIALAGPAVSLAIAAVAAVGGWLTADGLGLLSLLTTVNLMLGLFNLLPALPMDGGRVLRAVLTPRFGMLRATRIAVGIARALAVGLGLWALFNGHFFLVAMAVFLWVLGSRELRLAQMLAAQPRVGDYEVLSPDGQVVARYRANEGWTGGPRRIETTPRRTGQSPWGSPPESIRRAQSGTEPRRTVLVRGPDGRLWRLSSES